MPDAKTRIQQLASDFVAQLQQIARDEVVRIIDGAPSTATSRPRAKRSNGPGRRARGEKRSPAALDALQGRVLAVIRAKPALRVEQLNQELSTGAGELALPLRKLLTAKAIRTTGTRRATKYYVSQTTKTRRSKTRKSKK